ncbi:MAG: DUF6468 domain-containing protein [Pseudomonadota bacterium]
MFGIVSDLLTLIVGGLVIAVAIYASRLSRKLNWLRHDRVELEMLFRQFNESIHRAELVLKQLKQATGGGASHLKESIGKYQDLVARLDEHAANTEHMMRKLEEELSDKSRYQAKRKFQDIDRRLSDSLGANVNKQHQISELGGISGRFAPNAQSGARERLRHALKKIR